ncbi:lysine-specific demethylase JMJ31 [Amaranthus tricolor]|uniref:lysine-specific demethylase JMJ31 n=1 Tax=Amaranthus tricolor TaxID=29722 RepID=UPI00258EABA6|nr:lysine-specific demethylase JMJ31 [Amaranthus tricolor]
MEESLRVKEFEQIISTEEFDSQIEPLNIPAVFRGCVKDSKAFRNWNPSNGGLDYLQERGQSAIVEVMLSRSAPIFYGDIRSHDRVPLPFSSFIEFCKRILSKGDRPDESETLQSVVPDADMCNLLTNDREQIYLAQVPILNKESEQRAQLESLQDDIKIPSFLGSKKLSSINFWMNNVESRSSTHYDPHHNILCVVAGCKQVVLWPPSSGPFLYPMPIYGEASNHSAVALDSPDFSLYPRFEHANDYSQKVVLQAGDGLLIPEGWFHQVDSDQLTIAVNFWWRSDVTSSMPEHMDAYYLRIILRRLIDKEMNQMLHNTRNASFAKMRSCGSEARAPDNGKADGQGNSVHQNHENKLDLNIQLQDLCPPALQALHEIVSLIHEGVNAPNQQCSSTSHTRVISNFDHNNTGIMKSFTLNADIQQDQFTSTSDSGVVSDKDSKNLVIANFYRLEDDSIANIIWNLEPLDLVAAFLAMVHSFPRTLEALMLHMLSPVGAEVLTRKFDELDRQLTEEDRNKFYQRFYSIFDDQFAIMDAILKGKEEFALQAFKNILQLYMGVTLSGPSYKI